MAQTAPKTFTLEPFDYGEARSLMRALELTEPVAVTLVRRGYRTVEAARAFLEADEEHDPMLFTGMGEVVDRLRAAASAGRRITVHGDYDVDGVAATAILVRALRRLGAECDWFIPGRADDGYGLTSRTVARLRERGTQLLVTVDCGITSVAEVAEARALGLEVIVTDHHQPGPELPDCPILHPVVSSYPCAELCAAGVAFKLAAAIHGEAEVAEELDLVALATVADLVPLRGENRSLVRRGLAEARRARRPGMRALMETASVPCERLDEGDLAFRLGPRINAAGRLYRADAGVELMLTDDLERAAEIAVELDRANHERRAVEREVLAAAEASRRELPGGLGDAAGLVLSGEGWHPGVVGIVASRMVERHRRPVILIAIGADGSARGSGRGVPGFDLLAALADCSEHLGRFGGHRAAAGIEIDPAAIPAFREAFAASVSAQLGDEPAPPAERVDAVVGGESLGHQVATELARLGPFGQGNPGVKLLVPGAVLGDLRPMGEGDRHARFSLRTGSRKALGVAFGVGDSLRVPSAAGALDVSVELELNEWNGSVEPRVVLSRVYERAAVAGEPAHAVEPKPPGSPARPRSAAEPISDEEFWRRHDRELELALSPWPPPEPSAHESERVVVERRGESAQAILASLCSSGCGVLVVCADALRRRALVEEAVRPDRFGAPPATIVSSRLSDRSAEAADEGPAVALADWGAIHRHARLAERFEHVLVVDPPPFSHLERAVRAGSGYLHLLAGEAEIQFALQVLADEWPSRASLALVYRSLSAAGGALDRPAARWLLCGEGRAHPHSPEVAARSLRVLVELGLARLGASDGPAYLGVVSSEGTDLERSAAYTAYRARFEEGRRFLTAPRQSRAARS